MNPTNLKVQLFNELKRLGLENYFELEFEPNTVKFKTEYKTFIMFFMENTFDDIRKMKKGSEFLEFLLKDSVPDEGFTDEEIDDILKGEFNFLG